MEPEKEASDDQHLIAQKYRSDSRLKWWVLLDIFFSWTSAYFLTFGISSLETTLLTLFEWDSAQYSYLISATFLGAIIGPAMIPFIEAHSSEICTLFNNQLLLFFGEFFFALCLYLLTLTNKEYLYILLLFCRFVIGIGMGATDSLAQSSVNFWFGQSEFASQAFGVLIIGIEIGLLSSRFSLPVIYDYSGNISVPFFVSLAPVILAIIVNSAVKNRVIRSRAINPDWYSDENAEDSQLSTDSVRDQLRQLSFKIWCVIALVVTANVLINTVYTCYVDPLVETFDMTEYEADMLLSLCAVVVIIFNLPFSILADFIGGRLYLALIMSVIMLVSSSLLSYVAISDADNPNISQYGIAGIVIFSASLPLVSVVFAIQAIESPPQFASLIASISTTLWWIFSIFTATAIGWIYDYVGNYGYSLFVVFVFGCIQFVIALGLILVDKKEKGSWPKFCAN